MRRLHLSKHLHRRTSTTDGYTEPQDAEPLCGADDDKGIIKRGYGDGLLHHNAISAEYHCPDCVALFRLAQKRG